MSIDSSIPLSVRGPQLQNPLEVMQTVEQLRGLRDQNEARRIAGEKARRDAADQAAVRQVLTETGGDIEKALPRLRQIAPQAALEFETEINKARKEKFDAATHQVTARTKGLEFAANMAALVAANPARASAIRGHLQGISEEIRPLLPESDDPAEWQAFSDLALTAKERYDKGQAHLKLFGEGKLQEALGGGLSLANSAEEWTSILHTFRELGGPKAIADMFGEYSPANVARAGQLAITPHDRATLEGQATGRAQTAAHQQVLEQNAAAQLGISRGHLAVSQAAERRQGAAQPTPVDARATTESTLALVARLADHPGIGAATGAYEWRGFTQDAVDFNAIRDQLVAALTLPNLGALKGPMSDKDILFVKQLATRLGNTKLSEPETRRALAEARTFLQNKLDAAGGPRTAPPPPGGPAIGERRTVNGQLAEWDGRGWKAVR